MVLYILNTMGVFLFGTNSLSNWKPTYRIFCGRKRPDVFVRSLSHPTIHAYGSCPGALNCYFDIRTFCMLKDISHLNSWDTLNIRNPLLSFHNEVINNIPTHQNSPPNHICQISICYLILLRSQEMYKYDWTLSSAHRKNESQRWVW